MSGSPKNSIIILLGAILSFSVIFRVVTAILLGDQVVVLPGIYDQLSYHNLAVRVLGGYGFTFESQWWPLTAAGQPTAHWSYLYTLYLVVVYSVFGVHPLAARLIQAVSVGLLIPWITYRLALRVFLDNTTLKLGSLVLNIPLLAMIWTSFYGYFIYYAAALMTESFYILGILWTFDCAFRVSNPNVEIWKWLELGMAIGVTVLLRQVFLVFVPFLFIWLLWGWIFDRRELEISAMKRLGQGLARVAVAVLVLAVMIAPFTWFNYQRFGQFVLLNTNSGYAFFWANHPVHGNNFVAILTSDMPSYQDLIPPELRTFDEAAMDRELMRRGLGFVRQDPGRYLRLSISRIKDHFLFWPLPTSTMISNITRVGSLGIALPFMLLGAIAWFRASISKFHRLADWFCLPGVVLLSFVAVYDFVHLLSWAGIRYRLPTDALMLIFAANGLMICMDFLCRISSRGKKEAHAPLDV